MINIFEALLGDDPQMSFNHDRDLRSKSRFPDKNAATVHELMKEFKVNLAESQKLQTIYYNKHVEKLSYGPEKFVRFIAYHIKTKQNPKLENKYLGSFQIVKAVWNQVYKLKLHAKWLINHMFHILILEREVTRREAVDPKIPHELKFEEDKQ